LSEILLITLYLIPAGDGSLQRSIYQGFLSIASPINASLLFALLLMFTCWVVGYFLDKKRIYVRV
jgi:predicted acyltransferase